MERGPIPAGTSVQIKMVLTLTTLDCLGAHSRHVDRTGHAVNAAAQSSERLPIRHCPAPLPAEAARPARYTEQIAGLQIVGVAVTADELALQSFAVRQKPLASPLVHTRQTRCSPRT